MNPSPVRLKPTQGFFAAGSEMLEALQRLSDGAFKLFVYLCLNASRRTARLSLHSRNLARELSKSRRSILSYLQELQACGVCRVQPAANQHEFGEIEICDPFWPYEKLASSPADLEEQRYVQQVKQWFLAYPVVRSSFTAADRQLATELYHQEIPLQQVQRAFLLLLCTQIRRCFEWNRWCPYYPSEVLSALAPGGGQLTGLPTILDLLASPIKSALS